MNDDLHAIETMRTNLQFLCDVEVVMGFVCIMPMLKAMHELIKFAQSHDLILFYDFMGVVKMCYENL
jgi:hypothetical protein